MFLFVSCKQYDIDDENNNERIYQYSKDDVNRFVAKMHPFINYIKEQDLSFNNHKEDLNPFEITKNYFLTHYNENLIDINSSDQQAILQILNNNRNNYSKGNGTCNNDFYSYIENRGLYSQSELNIIYNFRDNLLANSDFDSSLNDFNANIMNSNEISLDSKNKLMRLSFMFSTFNSLYPDAFNNQNKMSPWCVAGLIALGISIVGLAEASIAVAAAEVVTEGMISSVFTSASGYVASLVSISGCFE